MKPSIPFQTKEIQERGADECTITKSTIWYIWNLWSMDTSN